MVPLGSRPQQSQPNPICISHIRPATTGGTGEIVPFGSPPVEATPKGFCGAVGLLNIEEREGPPDW